MVPTITECTVGTWMANIACCSIELDVHPSSPKIEHEDVAVMQVHEYRVEHAVSGRHFTTTHSLLFCDSSVPIML